jgi:hypothetical protein
MNDKSMKQVATFLGILFLVGTSCSDNSGLKTQLAVAQNQMANQATITQLQLTNAANQSKIKCLGAAGNDTTAVAACNSL